MITFLIKMKNEEPKYAIIGFLSRIIAFIQWNIFKVIQNDNTVEVYLLAWRIIFKILS